MPPHRRQQKQSDQSVELVETQTIGDAMPAMETVCTPLQRNGWQRSRTQSRVSGSPLSGPHFRWVSESLQATAECNQLAMVA